MDALLVTSIIIDSYEGGSKGQMECTQKSFFMPRYLYKNVTCGHQKRLRLALALRFYTSYLCSRDSLLLVRQWSNQPVSIRCIRPLPAVNTKRYIPLATLSTTKSRNALDQTFRYPPQALTFVLAVLYCPGTEIIPKFTR